MMRSIRQVHLYLGCFFAPMILYFSLSGAWQVFRFNDLPRKPRPAAQAIQPGHLDEAPEDTSSASGLNILFNELSKPHKESTAPGGDPHKNHSRGFDWIAAAMGLGLFSTTLLGVALALQVPKRRKWVLSSLIAGLVIPLLVLVAPLL